MKKKLQILLLGILLISVNLGFSQSNLLNQSVTYEELMQGYKQLAANYNTCDLVSFGQTDSGKPLHLFLINKSQEFYPEAIHQKVVLLVQNGIHAGEPCGIDASLEWATEMISTHQIPDNVVIAIIPVYNIGGMLNRGCCSRANQNGPEAHGFRGNARNLDLNRDYIKNDSKNAFAFARLFHWLQPELFIDTHTSNGADYQYTMTLISPRKEKLDAHLSGYLVNKLEPYLYANYDSLTPYVNVWGTTPNHGIKSFNDLSRYSTGYVGLFNCIGFTTESHMWKTFNARKTHTRKFLELLTGFADTNFVELMENKRICDAENPMSFEALNLEIDTTVFDSITFLSYQPTYAYSEILGRKQLYYNRSKPESIKIPYFNYFNKIDEVKVPDYYVIRSAWKEVVSRLRANQIAMIRLNHDSTITGLTSYIKHYKSGTQPYEGHYLHKEIEVVDSLVDMSFYEGDFMVSTHQKGWKYILNVLEAKSEDSFFAWNFYDEILQQKEWYSAYIFESYAVQMLEADPVLRMEYDRKMETNKSFAASGDARLLWLYRKSPFYESNHNRLPILKIFE